MKKKMQSDVERKKKFKIKIKIKIKPSGQNQRVNKEIVGPGQNINVYTGKSPKH